jgi:hypothetical protein
MLPDWRLAGGVRGGGGGGLGRGGGGRGSRGRVLAAGAIPLAPSRSEYVADIAVFACAMQGSSKPMSTMRLWCAVLNYQLFFLLASFGFSGLYFSGAGIAASACDIPEGHAR